MADRLSESGRVRSTRPDGKLRVRRLRKTYGPVVALADVDLELHEGEFLTLLGPSGSGKTTLLMMVAGLIQPDSGEVWIDGRLATYAPPFKRDVGMVFQNYALFPHLTVHENIAFPLRMRRVPEEKIRQEVRRVLEIVRLPDVAARLPRALSGGQQQRIALARCMVYQPSIILMDEPLGALDKKLRDQMQLEIKHLHTEFGITVLYVTHDQEEAMIMSDRICLMDKGQIQQIGTPDELYFHPRTLFAADFLGESNILSGEVAGVEYESVVVGEFGGVKLRAPQDERLREAHCVALMVRPERISVHAAGAAPPSSEARNALEGVLREVILVGGVTKYYITLDDGQRIVASALTGDTRVAATPGSRVSATWPVASGVLLPPREPAGR
ncbi:MAG TPA: ABC transporter ATP-binding protein [Methylomirabilota bacterium]|nr:ABC transporter ATP-binding protein [Methylomirabilota bacterium]